MSYLLRFISGEIVVCVFCLMSCQLCVKGTGIYNFCHRDGVSIYSYCQARYRGR